MRDEPKKRISHLENAATNPPTGKERTLKAKGEKSR